MGIQDFLAEKLRDSVCVGIGMSGEPFEPTARQLATCVPNLHLRSFKSAASLVDALRAGKVDAAVRGTLSSSAVIRELKRAFRLERLMRSAIVQDASGRVFMLLPVGIDEGMTARARLSMVMTTLSYFSPLGWRPSVGVLSKGRPEDDSRGAEIARSLKEGEWLASELTNRGVKAEHCGILVEDAVSRHELVVAPDGVSGNLMFRTLHFLGGCRAYGAPVVNMEKVFVDTSRAKSDYSDSLLLAARLAVIKSGSEEGP